MYTIKFIETDLEREVINIYENLADYEILA
jgi:hypothetical protein